MTKIVAEVGQNHENNLERAKKLADLAQSLGADSIKFQLMLSDFQESEMMKMFYLNNKKGLMRSQEWIQLSTHCRDNDIDFFVTCFDTWSIDFAIEILGVNKIKIASCSNRDKDLLKYAADTKYPVIISTGMAIHDEIKEAAEILKNATFLHCISEYPTADPNLKEINELRKLIVRHVGYSDHTLGVDAAVESICSYKVPILEVHFTDDNNFSDFRDHKLAKNPTQFSYIVGVNKGKNYGV